MGPEVLPTIPLRHPDGEGPSVETIRVLIADDHTLVRAGIRALLQGLEGVEVVAEAGDGREAMALARCIGPTSS